MVLSNSSRICILSQKISQSFKSTCLIFQSSKIFIVHIHELLTLIIFIGSKILSVLIGIWTETIFQIKLKASAKDIFD